jgi:hypothetical protein
LETSISNAISTADQKAQYDEAVKRLLSEKIVLAWILKECVSEFKVYTVQQIMKDCIEGEPKVSVVAVHQDELDADEELADKRIEGSNNEDSSIKEGKVYYDIRFNAIVPDTKEPIHLIINIEAQKSDNTVYPIIKRAIYYCSRMISSQKNTVFTKSHYEKIRKVYSIWIEMNVSEEDKNSITKYSISEDTIVGNAKEELKNYDLLSVLLVRLGDPDKADEKSILRLLDVLLSAEKKPDEKKELLEKDFDIPMSATMSKEVNTMCNLGEGLVEQTSIKNKADFVLRLMQKKHYDINEAFDLANVLESEKAEVTKLVDEQLAVK